MEVTETLTATPTSTPPTPEPRRIYLPLMLMHESVTDRIYVPIFLIDLR
jgi:hypothetical protein